MDSNEKKIRFITILEVLGKPKEHVEKAIRSYVDDVRENQDYLILREDFSDVKQQDNMWSVFVELEMVVKNVQEMFGFCFSYMPSSIEVLKPEKIEFSNLDVGGMLNDLQGKLHGLDTVAKKLRAENNFLKRNMKTTLSNLVLVILSVKGKCTTEDISELSGID